MLRRLSRRSTLRLQVRDFSGTNALVAHPALLAGKAIESSESFSSETNARPTARVWSKSPVFYALGDEGSEADIVDLSKVPEYQSLEIHDPFAVEWGGSEVEVCVARARSLMTQCARAHSGLALLKRRLGLTDPTRSIIAHNIVSLIDSIQADVPRHISPVSSNPSEFLGHLLQASKRQDLTYFYGLAAGLIHEKVRLIPDLPWAEWDQSDKRAYQRILEEYRDARAADSIAPKLKYVDRTFGEQLIPRMATDVAYFQAVAMLLSYLHIEVPQREISIPINMECTTMFNAADARRLMRCRRFVLRDWIMQTSGPHSGVKIRIWEAVDADNRGGEVFMVDCMGTNSVSPVRDQRLKRQGVVTGAMADIDPKGIVATAFGDLRAPIVERLRGLIPTDALVVCTGHSLGATTAHRSYVALHELGYDGAYLIAYNGGAFADDVSDELSSHASVHANHILNEGDPVPFGGRHLLSGTVKTNQIVHGGTIASPNPLFGIHRDPINHGNAEEVIAAYLGVPVRYSTVHSTRPHEWLIHRVNQACLTWAPVIPQKVITTVLKPEPEEWLPNQSPSYLSNPSARYPWK